VLSVHAFHILVIEVLPSRQQGVVLASGGSTPGYRDTVFQTGGASVLSVPAFAFMIIEVLPSRQQGVVRVSEGFTPVIKIPSSRRGAWWRAGPRTSPQLWRYCLPGSRVWCVRPGASPPVIEIPSSRRILWRVGPRASPRLWRCRLPDGLPSAHAYVFRQSSYDRCSCVSNRSLNRLVSRKKACVYVNLDLKH